MTTPKKSEWKVQRLSSITTWLSARMRQCAAREAVDMVKAAKERWKDKAIQPKHRGTRMCLSSAMVELQDSKSSTKFDLWLKLTSIGNKIKLFLPLKRHRQFNMLFAAGKQCGAYVITKDDVQFAFEIETEKKQATTKTRGIDTGIRALASTSDGSQFGLDIKQLIAVITRRKHGSKARKRAIARLHQRMGKVAKQVVQNCNAIVVENLKGITKTLRRIPNDAWVKICVELSVARMCDIG